MAPDYAGEPWHVAPMPADGLTSLGLPEFDAELGEPGKQVMAASPRQAASGEPGVIGELGDRLQGLPAKITKSATS